MEGNREGEEKEVKVEKAGCWRWIELFMLSPELFTGVLLPPSLSTNGRLPIFPIQIWLIVISGEVL